MATRRTSELLATIRGLTRAYKIDDELTYQQVDELVKKFDELDALLCKGGEAPVDWAVPSEHLIKNIYDLAMHLNLKDMSPAGIEVDWFISSPGGVRILPSIMGVAIHGGYTAPDPKPPVHELLYPFDKASLDMILQQAEEEST